MMNSKTYTYIELRDEALAEWDALSKDEQYQLKSKLNSQPRFNLWVLKQININDIVRIDEDNDVYMYTIVNRNK